MGLRVAVPRYRLFGGWGRGTSSTYGSVIDKKHTPFREYLRTIKSVKRIGKTGEWYSAEGCTNFIDPTIPDFHTLGSRPGQAPRHMFSYRPIKSKKPGRVSVGVTSG